MAEDIDLIDHCFLHFYLLFLFCFIFHFRLLICNSLHVGIRAFCFRFDAIFIVSFCFSMLMLLMCVWCACNWSIWFDAFFGSHNISKTTNSNMNAAIWVKSEIESHFRVDPPISKTIRKPFVSCFNDQMNASSSWIFHVVNIFSSLYLWRKSKHRYVM